MGSVYKRGPFWWISFRVPGGGRVARSSGIDSHQPKIQALRVLAEVERELRNEAKRNTGEPKTVAEYAVEWTASRRALKQTNAGRDFARLKLHVLPTLGTKRLGAVTVADVRSLVKSLRAGEMAPRTIINTYGLVRRLFADALAEELIVSSPCALTRSDLPKKQDKDPTWRAGAVYTRDEAQLLMTSPAVPWDRRVVYALAFLTGMRAGEIAALRWSAIDEEQQPLGRLLVAFSYTRQNKGTKATKTGVPRRVPVHPELAPVLQAWRAQGFEAQFGRAPRGDDLVVPNRDGAFRTDLNTLDGLALDLEALGLRHRDMHSMRRTFISLGREDSGNAAALKVVTHDQKGDVYDGYTVFTWQALCDAVSALALSTRYAQVVEVAEKTAASGGGTPNAALATQIATRRDFTVPNAAESQSFVGVPREGFEPSRREAPPPQDGVSTNSTTWAIRLFAF